MDISSQAKATKAKINKCNYTKLKNFCTVKETTNKTKKKPTEWENIFANNTSDKPMYPIYKGLMRFNIRKTNNSIKTWVENLNRFSQRRNTDSQQAHEKFSISIIFSEMQIKTTMCY